MTTLTAAAARYTTRTVRSKNSQASGKWQEQAWLFFDEVPEVRFAAMWISNAMNGARLIAARRDRDGEIEPAPDNHRATELVSSIAGGPDGQSQLLGGFGVHLTVPGEGWIVIRPSQDQNGQGEEWHVLSIAEMKQQGNKLVAEIDGEEVQIPPHDPDAPADPDAPIAIRVWQPHPRRFIEADSPVRSSRGLLEELQLLNAAVSAIARSRLTGRGVLLVPKGTRFPTPPGQQGDAEDDLIDVLMTVAETAYREPESAAATVPIVLEVPPETIGDIKRLTFESDFDELAIKLRDEAIRRFATGLEVPAEILLGMDKMNHWGAWRASEEAIQLGVEPRLATVAHALTTQWLRPLLEGEGLPDAHEWMVWYDTSPLRVRANRSQTALEVYDRGAISGEALRRETGFDEADAPAEGETPPALPAGTPGDPELPVDETQAPPDTLPASASPTEQEGLLAAVDGVIWAALSQAGDKLTRTPACPRSERARAKTVTPATLHTLLPVQREQVDQWRLLDGAFARVPEIAGRYGADPDCLTETLEGYCRELIAAGQEHAYAFVPRILTECTAGGESG